MTPNKTISEARINTLAMVFGVMIFGLMILGMFFACAFSLLMCIYVAGVWMKVFFFVAWLGSLCALVGLSYICVVGVKEFTGMEEGSS